MNLATAHELYAVTEATWPPVSTARVGSWTIRQGGGGGSRVSAATAAAPFSETDLADAEEAMNRLQQPRLFMIRQGDEALDALLAERGYAIKDPVNVYTVSLAELNRDATPDPMNFYSWPPLAAQREIWQQGGIGPARFAVMDRAPNPKTTIMRRIGNIPAGTLFIGVNNGIAMIHAAEVLIAQRRRGVARAMISAAGLWAANAGARQMALLVTQANTGANALYSSMGFRPVGKYHYRIKPE